MDAASSGNSYRRLGVIYTQIFRWRFYVNIQSKARNIVDIYEYIWYLCLCVQLHIRQGAYCRTWNIQNKTKPHVQTEWFLTVQFVVYHISITFWKIFNEVGFLSLTEYQINSIMEPGQLFRINIQVELIYYLATEEAVFSDLYACRNL